MAHFDPTNKPDIQGETIPKPVSIAVDPVTDDENVMDLPTEVSVLPVRNAVAFPGSVMPLSVQRESSQKLINDLLPEKKMLVMVCQKDPDTDKPNPDDLYQVGTAMMVLRMLRMDDGGMNIIVQGLMRVRITEWTGTEPFMRAKVEPIEDITSDDPKEEAMMLNVRQQAIRVIELTPNIPDEMRFLLSNIDSAGTLADFIAANMQIDPIQKQDLLEEPNVLTRLETISFLMQKQIDLLELSHKIQDQVREKVDKSQREFFLNEQLKAIQKELGQADEKSVDVQEITELLTEANLPEAVEKEAFRELRRLDKLSINSPDYHVLRTYLELLGELPWDVSTPDDLDLKKARKILDADHYDLTKVKKRILEYLVVRKLAPDSHGPIICFVGPPGVGKTSLGKSIARAVGRKFIRMSLGGMRDEAELRGHRRTYIGAMPGRIIQEIRKVGANNPVFMLDEIDKLGSDFRGDPTSALLEILDPAQNNSFQDHYLNVPFNLSKVLFIATANYIGNIPPALRDRMEIINLAGYTQLEKLNIAREYLVPRQLKQNGITDKQAKWNDDALSIIIDQYTKEAGVRELERQIGAVCRGVAAMIVEGKAKSRAINKRFLTTILGPRKYENELAMRKSLPGVVTGLAYTPVGGTILFVEATTYAGKGNLILTGQIGDVMKESAQAALSLIKSNATKLGVDLEELAKQDIHIHVPEGATPKDGPSAGVSMFTALASVLTNKAVNHQIAMTGEITLRGLVLPIGGVKEKVLAAKLAGIKKVILPAANKKDLHDVPDDAKNSLEFEFVKNVDQLLKLVLKK